MSTLVIPPTVASRSCTPPPLTPMSISSNVQIVNASAIPNKHIPYCPPGPNPAAIRARTPVTPPASPPAKKAIFPPTSLLFPPSSFEKLSNDPPLYSIDTDTLSKVLDHVSSTPIPDPKHVFPWLHGLHYENHIQTTFFLARRKAIPKIPKMLRALTIIKAGGDLTKARIKGAIAPAEILYPAGEEDGVFHDIDPREGFSVRNFHIQAAKLAMLSDIIVYKDDETDMAELKKTARLVAIAQKAYREKCQMEGGSLSEYNTFVISDMFHEIQSHHPDIIAVDAGSQPTGNVLDLFHLERQEMSTMTSISEITNNVWLGPSPDAASAPVTDPKDYAKFDIQIETNDAAHMPSAKALRKVAAESVNAKQQLEFPASGTIMPPTVADMEGIVEICRWIYKLANPDLTPDSSTDGEVESDSEGDIPMKVLSPRGRKILIHCADGYTESTMLGLAYFIFAEGIPIHEAWIRLHRHKRRNFFAYPTDVALLTTLQPKLLQESPRNLSHLAPRVADCPQWFRAIDGSLPSRILSYMYLGNLGHANNPDLLEAMGITRVLSVGEPIGWSQKRISRWGSENLLFVDRVQDNGVDSLTEQFERCLEFIREGRRLGTATLVHCRVGVSRSATICIAEVMEANGLSFPRAYCFVRARRLNVIIQPHLRFAYELLKWEETQRVKRGQPLRREMEWATIARDIAAMNKPYTK